MRIFYLIMLFLFAPLSVLAADFNSFLKDFDADFVAEVTKNKIPGSAYAVVKDGKVVAMRTLGNRAVDADLAVSSKTVFRLASVSKTFAAELAAMLAAEQKFSLDAPVLTYIPTLAFKDAAHAKGLKVRHLLSHSSGITPNAYDNMLEDDRSLDHILPYFARLEPMCQPGDCYGYQNILFSLIDPVIEKSTGQSYGPLLTERILKPLDMETASVGLEDFLVTSNRAEPHVFTKRDGWIRVLVDPNYYRVAPAAGVNASIEDMTKWVLAQMGKRPDVISPNLLKTVTTKEVRTTRELNRKSWRRHISDAHYGLGWRIYSFGEREVVLHSGAVRGYRAFISYSNDTGIGFVMLMNAQTRAIDRLSVDFWNDALDLFPETGQAAR